MSASEVQKKGSAGMKIIDAMLILWYNWISSFLFEVI